MELDINKRIKILMSLRTKKLWTKKKGFIEYQTNFYSSETLISCKQVLAAVIN